LIKEIIPARKSTSLRKNNSRQLEIDIHKNRFLDLYLINENNFRSVGISKSDLLIKPNSHYMVINNGKEELELQFSQDISNHEIIYNPYKYEFSEKVNFTQEFFINNYDIPEGFIDILPKWYSFKFTYPEYNLIFVKPEFGLSIQIHKYRNESWEILDGNPVVINGNNINYYVKPGTIFHNPINTYHSVINTNREADKFVIIKERWNGKFDENDIKRVFNPNQYA